MGPDGSALRSLRSLPTAEVFGGGYGSHLCCCCKKEETVVTAEPGGVSSPAQCEPGQLPLYRPSKCPGKNLSEVLILPLTKLEPLAAQTFSLPPVGSGSSQWAVGPPPSIGARRHGAGNPGCEPRGCGGSLCWGFVPASQVNTLEPGQVGVGAQTPGVLGESTP